MRRYVKVWIFVTLFAINGIAQGAGRWSRTGDINRTRSGFPCVLLTDARVMAVGGMDDPDYYEIWDPATGKWERYSMLGSINHDMAMLLPNGKALMTTGSIWSYDTFLDTLESSTASFGGWTSKTPATLLKNGKMLAIACDELYNYTTDKVTSITGAAYSVHKMGTETMLPDGRVLAAGSFFGDGILCEIYDPNSETWALVDSLNIGRYSHVGMLLPPPWSEVLVAGGASGGNETCELYNPGLNAWTMTDSMSTKRDVAAMALLPSGEALITGGSGKTCELYNPAAKEWRMTDSMELSRNHHAVVVLPTGKILAVGEFGGNSPNPCEIYDPSNGAWATKPSLNVARAGHTVTPLPIIPTLNCSTNVLIVGGENPTALKSCELYNYSLDTVSVTDDLDEARTHHTAVLLASGQVLVAGGKNDVSGALSSSEIYTAGKPGNWAPTGDMTDARFDHSATLLENGNDVLVTGGEDAGTYLSSCEIYNGSWTPTGSMMATPRARHTAIILLNGNILVIGGQTAGGGATTSCELWNGTIWSPAASLSIPRYLHTATLLQSGKVLVIGGKDAGGASLSNCEVFDPDSNKWFPEGNLNQARHSHNTTVLYSGLVLVTGGNSGSNSCETYDPATHKWTTDYTGTLATGRVYHSSVLVPDTMPFILAIGGKDGGGGYLNSIEEYDVGLGYRQIWQSTITSHSAVTTITGGMNIRGTDFRGFSEADGGNYCHIASNDHPIISLVRVGGGNWQGNGGGEIMYIPPSTKWDTAHTKVHLPANALAGYYRLWSIVNGIPCTWYKPCPPSGAEEKTGIKQKATGISVSVYPNPATTKTSIKFRVQSPELKNSRLTIHDLSGRLIRSFTIPDAGFTTHEITWDRRDSQGKKVNSGVYFYSIKHKDSGVKGKFVILQ